MGKLKDTFLIIKESSGWSNQHSISEIEEISKACQQIKNFIRKEGNFKYKLTIFDDSFIKGKRIYNLTKRDYEDCAVLGEKYYTMNKGRLVELTEKP